jgi:hypothetical protein
MRLLLGIILLFSINSINAQTWSDGVGKIFQQNCVQCHRQGGVAPFSLETYNDVAPIASVIQASINAAEMPPWTPDPNYKEFVHQRVMDPADVQTINDWVTNGTPEGNPAQAPSIATFPAGSQLGTPDLSLTIPTFTVNSNTDVYYNFELPSGLAQQMFANAVEVVPGNTDVVHHVLVYQDSTNNPIDPTSMGGTGSPASKLIYGYTPGAQPYYTPPGAGFRLPANTRIILQIHYAPGSLGQTDQTTVNFKLSPGPQREIFVDPVLNHGNISNGPLFIPANQTATFNQDYTVPVNATVLYVFPHMHLIGRSIRSWANLPITGDTVRFINIPDWDFHWQDNFIFPNTIPLPLGSIMQSEAYYDNTTNNPYNPSNPPLDVSAGEGTYDEMMLIFFAYMYYQAGDENIIVDDRIFPKGATDVCTGETVLLTAIEGIGYTYQWYLNGNPIAGATNSTYEAAIAGDYTLEINLGPNTTFSDPITVTINALPSVTITPPGATNIPLGDSILLDATNDPTYSYQWYLDGVAINGATDYFHYATTGGDYYVLVSNGCSSLSDTVSLTATASLSEKVSHQFIVYPNPAKETLSVINKDKTQDRFEIINLLGEECSSGTLDGIMTKVDLSTFKPGSYILKIYNQRSGEVHHPFIIQ